MSSPLLTKAANGSVEFFPSQTPLSTDSQEEPPPYTAGPLLLLWSDIVLITRCAPAAFGIFWPFKVRNTDVRDELCLSDSQNLLCIALHALLLVSQSLFMVSWIFFLTAPVLWAFAAVAVYMLFNNYVCTFLNGATIRLDSKVPVENEEKHDDEYWIFLNGVSVGRHWLQSNCDRLSETFGRRIHGVHNPTCGIIFDIIQCMIQRALCYPTQDVRDAYGLVKKAILNKQYQKIIFILHSQGGIEGGLVLDWLLDEVPHDLLHRCEIYTFGNAANHFNNPHSRYDPSATGQSGGQGGRKKGAVRHIEHYANSGDFVARFGVLNYMGTVNRYMGRVFQSPHSGHLLNQHYLHQMFPLTKDRKAQEDNEFMQMEVSYSDKCHKGLLRESLVMSFASATDFTGELDMAYVGDVNSPISPNTPQSLTPLDNNIPKQLRVGDLSRLWKYRNGKSPEDSFIQRRVHSL